MITYAQMENTWSWDFLRAVCYAHINYELAIVNYLLLLLAQLLIG